MRRIEVYTPWREPLDALRRRHVPRDALERRLSEGAVGLAKGKPPLPLYLFGPRGVGKSHLLALARGAAEEKGLRVVHVPEDIPALRSADELLNRIAGRTTAHAPWERWDVSQPAQEPRAEAPFVVIIEALDRRLADLGPGPVGRSERQKLRGAWSNRRDLWLVASGIELDTSLTDVDEPFFGWFDAEHVPLFGREDAHRLLDATVPDAVRSEPHWPGRREALCALAGGSPRVLVTLADTCASPNAPEAATDALLAAVDRFTAHYQLRFHDLPPHGQHLVDALAAAPRELSPGELAAYLDNAPATVATQLRRLADDGVLTRREDGRSTWYSIAEPLFRFWLEYRTSPWPDTRVWIATTLLQQLFSPAEIVDRWWSATEDDLTGLAVAADTGSTKRKAIERVHAELAEALLTPDLTRIGQVLKKADQVQQRHRVERVALSVLSQRGSVDGLAWFAATAKTAARAATLQLAADLRRRQRLPRALFRSWLASLRPDRARTEDWATLSPVVLDALEATRSPGKPWELTLAEQAKLAKIPYLRVALLLRGRLHSHPAVLSPSSLVVADLDPTDQDLGQLLAAATERDDDALVARVLTQRAWTGPRAPLGRCPRPHREVLAHPDLLVRWMSDDLETRPGAHLLSWARSLANVDGSIFQNFLAALDRHAHQLVGSARDVQAGLTALGVAAPERLASVASAIGRAALGSTVARSAALARQLTNRSAGRLHPELDELVRVLSVQPKRP